MKGGDEMPKTFKEGFMRWAVAAGSASFAETATFPLVVLSSRQQLLRVSDDFPKEQIKARKSMLKLGRAIVKGEGVGALYSGVPASILRQAIYGGIGIGLYPIARNAIVGPGVSKKDAPLWKRMLAASSTGAFGQLVGNPTDVVRVRMATGGNPASDAKGSAKPYRSTAHAFLRIARDEGFAAFYSGVVPSVVRAAVINGCGIASYDHTKQAVIRMLGTNDGLGPQVLGSSMSGLVSATVSTPFDVIKTRLMSSDGAQMYRGAIHCLVKTVKSEGALALYNGFWPTYTRLAPWQMCFFVLYEQLNKRINGVTI